MGLTEERIIFIGILMISFLLFYLSSISDKIPIKLPIAKRNLKGKKIIKFTTHGCMGNDHEFDYIGVIIGKKRLDGSKYLEVKVLKDNMRELRDKPEEPRFELIPAWYIQDIGNGTFVIYD